MKKIIFGILVVCLLLAGCGKTQDPTPDATTGATESTDTGAENNQEAVGGEEQAEPAVTVYPLPDSTMENLTDAILSVSFNEGDAYVDDTGKMQLDVKIYTYDMYDAVDIANLKVGDIVVTHAGDVTVTSVERGENGNVLVNGGLEAGGFELVSKDGGIFCEIGFNDAKNWYEVGEATIRVSVDFMGYDNADPDLGEVILYPGSFLVGEVENYNFTPYNTTIRVEDGQVIEMNRIFTP
ncbi:MAG: hypothetical protein IKT47_07910 [Oscillospiraceae bacterium]|nr:hypothetical protein [Oscillospiraceae bacterium]